MKELVFFSVICCMIFACGCAVFNVFTKYLRNSCLLSEMSSSFLLKIYFIIQIHHGVLGIRSHRDQRFCEHTRQLIIMQAIVYGVH